MKRHPALRPFSRDHHHALVQVRNLNLAVAENHPDSLSRGARSFVGFWATQLEEHFRLEEQLLLPLFARHAGADRREIDETLKQHIEIARMVNELKLALDERIDSDSLSTLAESLRSHVRFEEHELFPSIEASVPEDELQRMSEQLNAGPSCQFE